MWSDGHAVRVPAALRETCRLQGRRLHEHLTDAITADLSRLPLPPLLAPP